MCKVDFASVFAVRPHLLQCLFSCITSVSICSSWKWMKWTSYAFLSIGVAFGSSTLLRCIANTESKSSCQAQSTDICRSGGPSARHIFTLHPDFPLFFISCGFLVCVYLCLYLSIPVYICLCLSIVVHSYLQLFIVGYSCLCRYISVHGCL